MANSSPVVGIDACAGGWFATIISDGDVETRFAESFTDLYERYSDAKRVLVDIPIGLPTDSRRRCDELASDLLGCRGISVFYPPCASVVDLSEYEEANREHEAMVGHGLSQQAFHIRTKIREVDATLPANEYDGVVRESHPELCFYALNGQPIAYGKSSERGRDLRLKLLREALERAETTYREVRKEFPLREVGRDDILDSMVLAIAAKSEHLQSVPPTPGGSEPRIYYPDTI